MDRIIINALVTLILCVPTLLWGADSCTYESRQYSDGSFHDPSSKKSTRMSKKPLAQLHRASSAETCAYNNLNFSISAFHQNGEQCQKCGGGGNWITIDDAFCTHHQRCQDGVWFDKEP
jgi:hypothetical protein